MESAKFHSDTTDGHYEVELDFHPADSLYVSISHWANGINWMTSKASDMASELLNNVKVDGDTLTADGQEVSLFLIHIVPKLTIMLGKQSVRIIVTNAPGHNMDKVFNVDQASEDAFREFLGKAFGDNK